VFLLKWWVQNGKRKGRVTPSIPTLKLREATLSMWILFRRRVMSISCFFVFHHTFAANFVEMIRCVSMQTRQGCGCRCMISFSLSLFPTFALVFSLSYYRCVVQQEKTPKKKKQKSMPKFEQRIMPKTMQKETKVQNHSQNSSSSYLLH
jgi:hypothetical protein